MNVIARTGAVALVMVALATSLAACQTSGTVTPIATDRGDAPFTTWLAKPEGDGPFPAVVLVHGCAGTQRNTSHQTDWRGMNGHATLLNDNGYVTLIVDSFGPRGITDDCQTGGKYYPLQISDAYDAFDHMASLPYVERKRIGLVGFSLGGGTAMQLALRNSVKHREKQDRSTYAALVAYYPWCEVTWAYSLVRPVQILIGSEDDWTPADQCNALRELAKQSTRKPVVELVIYPGAHHSFDMPMRGPYYIEGEPGVFHTVQGNPAARRDSQARMLGFFETHLGSAR